MVDEQTIYAAGLWGTIIKTTDGGETWTTIQSLGEYYPLTGICFTGENTGFVIADYGLILKTINGGMNWTNVFLIILTYLT